MPNLSIYEQDRNGNDLDEYYSMLPTVSNALRDQLNHKNPVALAYLAKSNETSYNITPEFKLNYRLLGLDDQHHRLDYEGKVVFNIFNRYDDQFMPLSLSTTGWNDSGSNRTSSNSSKSLGVTTTHQLTFVPKFNNKDHSLQMLLRGQLTSGTSSSQSTTSWGLPSGTIESTAAEGIISGMSTGSAMMRNASMGDTMSSDTSICLLTVRLVVSTLW
jgi:hypothetical protein